MDANDSPDEWSGGLPAAGLTKDRRSGDPRPFPTSPQLASVREFIWLAIEAPAESDASTLPLKRTSAPFAHSNDGRGIGIADASAAHCLLLGRCGLSGDRPGHHRD